MREQPAAEPSGGGLRLALALLALAACLAGLNQVSDLAQPGAGWRFSLLGGVSGLIAWAAIRALGRMAEPQRAVVFWIVAIGLRVLVLPMHPGDDLWRYLWEGRIQTLEPPFNPYLVAPDAAALEPFRTPWWRWINHPEWASIYPPGAQVLFAGLARVGDDPWLWKVVFGACDLAIVALLLGWIRGGDRYRTAAWYAWNPLAIVSFAGAGHYDSTMVLALLGAAACVRSEFDGPGSGEKLPARRWVAAGLLLGIALSLKAVPVLLLPLWALVARRRFVWMLPGLAIPALLALAYGFPSEDILGPLREFTARARTNDMVWWIWEAAAGPRPRNGAYSAVLVLVVLAIAWRMRAEPGRGILWVLGAAVVLSPVLHPWYLCWVLPFAALRSAWPWSVFSVSIFGYYLLWESGLWWVPWEQPVWQRLLIALPPVIALALCRRAKIAGLSSG